MDDGAAPLANVITLGAGDLPALRDFYRHLGWPLVVDSDDFAAFELRGAVLALFPAEKLAADGRGQPDHGRGGIRFTIGVMAENASAVDELTELMRRAGGRVTKEPVDAEFFEGRSAYVADPEGNFWEIAWALPSNAIVAAARRAAGQAR
ncbi:MAG: VOC family protein [Chloroflexota bacterium]|nr:VOC family protein [Chloroflexota bacterium]